MKKVKRMLQVCLGMLAVVAVVGLAKMDVKAAAQVTGLKQTSDTTTSVEVAWNEMAQGKYANVYYKLSGSSVWSKPSTTSSNSDYLSGLNPGSDYDIKVELYSNYDRQPSQLVASGTMKAVTAPGQYTSFAIKQTAAGTSNTTVSWNACPGANYYKLEYKIASGESRVTYVSGTSTKLTGLKKNSDTYVYVTPCRKSAQNYYTKNTSNYKSLRMAVAPSKPQTKYVYIYNKNEANIAIDDNSSNYYAEGFTCEIYKVSGNKKIKTLKTTSRYPDYKNNAFKKNDLFKVRVKSYATGADGTKYYSGWSSWSYFSTHNLVKSAKKSGSGIAVKWNKINGASGYKVYASTNRDKGYKVVATIKKGKTTSATFKKYNKKALKKGKTYYVYVEPFYKSGKKNVDVVNYWLRYATVKFK